jgi:chromosome partitioning protein
MPTLVLCSPKGGVGKTTSAVLIALILAEAGSTVTLIDGDPNQPIARWAGRTQLPAGLTVVEKANQDTIQHQIEAAAADSAFVIVDTEGTAGLMVSYAIAEADLVIIPVQGSQLDAIQARRAIDLIKATSKSVRRTIDHVLLRTRVNPAVRSTVVKEVFDLLSETGVDILKSGFNERSAYLAIFGYGRTLSTLDGIKAGDVKKAAENARQVASEIIARLKKSSVASSGKGRV